MKYIIIINFNFFGKVFANIKWRGIDFASFPSQEINLINNQMKSEPRMDYVFRKGVLKWNGVKQLKIALA